jgi:hypothetical protein
MHQENKFGPCDSKFMVGLLPCQNPNAISRMSDSSPSHQARKRPPSVLAKIALKDGLSSGGCPVCYASRKTTRRYLHSFLYEGMMSSIARQEFLDGGGFCREHFWQAKGIEEECWADGIGVSILCENLLEVSLKSLEAPPKKLVELTTSLLKIRRPAKVKRSGVRLLPEKSCLACKVAKETGEHYLSTLEDLLEDGDFCERFKKSTGLCLQHAQAASGKWASDAAIELVTRTAEDRIRYLLNELREFQRKHDYRFKHEPRGSEWSSPERTINFLVGPKADLRGFVELRSARRPRS